MNKQDYINALYDEFTSVCGYIITTKDVVQMFVDECGVINDMERATDLLRDFILSQGLEEEVVF